MRAGVTRIATIQVHNWPIQTNHVHEGNYPVRKSEKFIIVVVITFCCRLL
jgi:hypothetical protein